MGVTHQCIHHTLLCAKGRVCIFNWENVIVHLEQNIAAGGEPSTKLPPGKLVKQLALTHTSQTYNGRGLQATQQHEIMLRKMCWSPAAWSNNLLRERCLCTPSSQLNLPRGRNSKASDYKSACKTPAQTNKGITSTVKPKVDLPHICPIQRAGQSHLRRYYSSAEAHAVAALQVMSNQR